MKAAWAATMLLAGTGMAYAEDTTQYHAADAPVPGAVTHLGNIMPVMMDQSSWFHGILEQAEGRYAPMRH